MAKNMGAFATTELDALWEGLDAQMKKNPNLSIWGDLIYKNVAANKFPTERPWSSLKEKARKISQKDPVFWNLKFPTAPLFGQANAKRKSSSTLTPEKFKTNKTKPGPKCSKKQESTAAQERNLIKLAKGIIEFGKPVQENNQKYWNHIQACSGLTQFTPEELGSFFTNSLKNNHRTLHLNGNDLNVIALLIKNSDGSESNVDKDDEKEVDEELLVGSMYEHPAYTQTTPKDIEAEITLSSQTLPSSTQLTLSGSPIPKKETVSTIIGLDEMEDKISQLTEVHEALFETLQGDAQASQTHLYGHFKKVMAAFVVALDAVMGIPSLKLTSLKKKHLDAAIVRFVENENSDNAAVKAILAVGPLRQSLWRGTSFD